MFFFFLLLGEIAATSLVCFELHFHFNWIILRFDLTTATVFSYHETSQLENNNIFFLVEGKIFR